MKKYVDRILHSEAFHDFKGNHLAMAGAIVLSFFLLIALIGPFFTPQNPYDLKQLSLVNAFQKTERIPSGTGWRWQRRPGNPGPRRKSG